MRNRVLTRIGTGYTGHVTTAACVPPSGLRLCLMDRRQFALGSIPAVLLTGCHSGSKPSREATLFHNRAVNTAIGNLEEAVNMVQERLTGFGPENWRDALSNLQTATIRLRSDMDELRRALGYADTADSQQQEHS